jgi:hypothetical protein
VHDINRQLKAASAAKRELAYAATSCDNRRRRERAVAKKQRTRAFRRLGKALAGETTD